MKNLIEKRVRTQTEASKLKSYQNLPYTNQNLQNSTPKTHPQNRNSEKTFYKFLLGQTLFQIKPNKQDFCSNTNKKNKKIVINVIIRCWIVARNLRNDTK